MTNLIKAGSASLVFALFLIGCGSTSTVQAPVTTVDTVYVEKEVMVDPPDLPKVEAERFDSGKMWTFDNPPLDYFAEEYGFEPDSAWFEAARLGALRLSNCSASFVSPHGLVMTNHHCARAPITQVSETDEELLDKGFYAQTISGERRIDDYAADQLIRITDVTTEVQDAMAEGETNAERISLRDETLDEIQQRLEEEVGMGHHVEIISLYNGGQYSAYIFKRYDDIRLVMGPELRIGYFGGDPDNFTYPRYNLDVSFYRVYENGEPVSSPNYFKWSTDGSKEGDAVFVIGNPGSTNRLQTTAELAYRRDHLDPLILRLYTTRVEDFASFFEEDPEASAPFDLQNLVFSIENTIKARTGILEGLTDPMLFARKVDGEHDLIEAIANDPALSAKYGGLFEEMTELHEELAQVVSEYGAFILNPASSIYATISKRAALAYIYASQLDGGVPADALSGLKQQILDQEPYPTKLETYLLTSRLEDLVFYLGEDDERVRAVLQGRTPAEAARQIAGNTGLLNEEVVEDLITDFNASDDAAVTLGRVLGEGLASLQQVTAPINARVEEISGKIASARFDVYGTTFPPDATFSLRISDGVVASYPYNGTIAPAYTTFYGLYDRYYSHNKEFPWSLPDRWVNPPVEFDRSTPLNFVSTCDIIGGNSGSPVINADLEVVGAAFDSNIDALPGEFIYTEEVARTVSVDSRGILEALDVIYDADRIVLELVRGELAASEQEADEIMAR